MMKNKKNRGPWIFFGGTVASYIVLAALRFNLFEKSLAFFLYILLKIIPIFLLIWVLMALVDRYVNTKTIVKYFPKEGRKGNIRRWGLAIIAGVLSMGSIYMWYPLLSDLHEKGFDYGLIACFLYNRAIKVPLLPIAVYYFGLKYVTILTVVMILASILQGLIINRLVENKI